MEHEEPKSSLRMCVQSKYGEYPVLLCIFFTIVSVPLTGLLLYLFIINKYITALVIIIMVLIICVCIIVLICVYINCISKD